MTSTAIAPTLSDIDVDLSQSEFFGDVASTLAGALEDTIGLVEASSFVGEVGDQLGTEIGDEYRSKLGKLPASTEELAALLCDLKRRIGGDFSVETIAEDEIILVNSRCPFAERVEGQPSLCMMTTNVFGRIVSDARGYARVTVEQAIAAKHKRCRVRISLLDEFSDDGYEFFG